MTSGDELTSGDEGQPSSPETSQRAPPVVDRSRSKRGAVGPVNAIQRALSLEPLDDRPIYKTEFPVAEDYVLPEDLEVGKIGGLVLAYVCRPVGAAPSGKSASRVVTYWRSRELFVVNRGSFFRACSLEAPPAEGAGLLSDVKTTRISFFKRFPVYALVLGVAAFVGALEAIHNRYGLFFGSPDAHVIFDKALPIHLLENKKGRISVLVHNQSRVVGAEVTLEQVFARAADGRPDVDLTPGTWPREVGPIKAGESKPVPVSLAKVLSPGNYQLVISARKKGGLLFPSEVDPYSHALVVWQEWSHAPFVHAQTHNERSWFQSSITPGRELESGLRCQVTLKGFKDLEIIAVLERGVNSLGEIVSIENHKAVFWNTPPLPAYEPASFKIGVEGKDAGLGERIAAGLTIDCKERKG